MNKFDTIKEKICDSIMQMNIDGFYDFLNYIGGAEFGNVVIPQIMDCNKCPYNTNDVEECFDNCRKYYMELIGKSENENKSENESESK